MLRLPTENTLDREETIMAEWLKTALIDIVELIGGGTPKTSKAEYWGGNINWLSVKDFNNENRYVYSTEKTITEEGLNNSSTKLLKKDDIIISARGTVGELAMIPFPMAFNQSCYGIRAKEGIDSIFLYYLIKNSVRKLKAITHGSVFDTITRERDIVIRREDIEWEIGLSIKHNHDAVKHSRLSHKLDFGKEWFDMPCSDAYWDAVQPIFDMLKNEKDNGSRWSEINDKDEVVYVPLLQAFMDEVNRAYKEDKNMPRKMIEYLIGIEDYYKVVSRDSKRLTMIHTFNMHDTLNKPSENKVSAITVPVVELPTRLVALEFKPGSTNTVEMFLDNGWQLSFRIHNASTKVEPSLKFDVQFIGMPTSVLNIECKWK